MQLQWPWVLGLLPVVALLAARYLWTERARRSAALRYASAARLRDAIGAGPGRLRHAAPALYLISLVLLLAATARPTGVVTVPSEEGTVILAIDISGSMQAQDVEPSRLAAAKAAARRFVERQSENDKVRIGIVAFSDAAFIVQPPTASREAAEAAIARLATQRGTAIGRGILASLDALVEDGAGGLPSDGYFAGAGRAPSPLPPQPARAFGAQTIVLLTDGVNTQPPSPLAVLDEATRRGVRIYTIGLGTPNGAAIGFGGRRINARLDEPTLRSIAETTDGEYFNASSAAELQRIYDHVGTQLVFRTVKTELSPVFVALAAAAALAAACLSLTFFNRLP